MGRGERLIRTSGAKRWCVVMADSLHRMSRREEATCRWRMMGRKRFDNVFLGHLGYMALDVGSVLQPMYTVV